MNVTIDRTYDFTPAWNENAKEDKPVVFHMRLLTTAERDRFMDFRVGADGKSEQTLDRQGMFNAGVVSIDNLMVNGETVKDARGVLLNPGLYQLFLEVIGDIIGRNVRPDLKNS